MMRDLVKHLRASRQGIVYCRRGIGVPPAIALTFDDGPSEWTPAILDVLGGSGGKATFFVLGQSIAGREDVLRRAVADGHELGNHGWSHADPATLDDRRLAAELERTNAAIEEVTGARPRIFRPPYADADRRVASVARAAGFAATVLRSIDPADWRSESRSEIAAHVLERAVRGAVVCLHDGVVPSRDPGARPTRDETVGAVEELAVALPARGLRLVTVSELLA
jgi:peptidoglycan-N-acetylglucosamine deacetylase